MVRAIVPEVRIYSAPLRIAPADVHDDARRLVSRSQDPSLPSSVAENPPDEVPIVFLVSHASTVSGEQFA